MDSSRIVPEELRDVPLAMLFDEHCPSEQLLRCLTYLDYEQLAEILGLDAATAAQYKEKEPVERALRTWIAMHGQDTTISDFVQQLVRTDVEETLASAISFRGIAMILLGWNSEPEDYRFDVYIGEASDDVLRAFLTSAEERHSLKVWCEARDAIPGTVILDNIYDGMIRSRFHVIFLPHERSDDFELFEQELAVQLFGASKRLIAVQLKESPVPSVLKGFKPLVKRDDEDIDELCDRICETIIHLGKSQSTHPGLDAECRSDAGLKRDIDPRQDADRGREVEKGAMSAAPTKPSKAETRTPQTSLLSSYTQGVDVLKSVIGQLPRSALSKLVTGVNSLFRSQTSRAAAAAPRHALTPEQGVPPPQQSVAEAVNLNTDGGVERPVFSQDWQFQQSFSARGGQLRGRDSDVILVIPKGAVRDECSSHLAGVASHQPLRGETSKSVSEKAATPSGVKAEENSTDGGLIIRGAISTDLERVHDALHLGKSEFVSSPVAEYFAGENFTFQRPVSIFLPHFLPPGFRAGDVRVYQFHKGHDGQIRVNTLQHVQHEDNAGDAAVLDATQAPAFYRLEESQVQVVTTHFSGYLCTLCKKEMDPPHLRLRLYGKHVQRHSRDVDLTLFIWDLRLDIRDFRKAGLPNAEEEKSFLVSQTLEPLKADWDVERLELGVSLHLSEEDSAIWMHWSMGGVPISPPQRRLGIKKFVPCCLDTIPERVDWALLTRHDPAQPRWFQCAIDVGYVTAAADDAPLLFLFVPRRQTLQIRGLELLNEQRSATTQTDQDLTENTHVKRLEGAVAASLTRVDDVASAACSPPLSGPPATAASSTSPRGQGQCSSSVGSSQRSRAQDAGLGEAMGAMCVGSHGAATSQGATAPYRDGGSSVAVGADLTAACSSRGSPVAEGSSEVKQVVYQNCTFNMQANKNTTNNSVRNLQEMNVGNTTHVNTEGDQELGPPSRHVTPPHHVTPPYHVTDPDLPEVEEVVRHSLAHHSYDDT